MSSHLFLEKIRQTLLNSRYALPNTKSNSKTISPFICDTCGEKTGYAYDIGPGNCGPWAVICNRGNKCGARNATLKLFPELRQNIEKDFPASKDDPNRPSREYLKSRGLNISLANLDHRYLRNVRKTGSGAVMFPVGRDEKGKEILNGRLFNPPPGEGKTHNIGSTAGRYWRHPGIEYDPSEKTWITEGIIDALSLIELGIQAIAVLASGQSPDRIDLSEFKIKVLAFDNDDAGHRACRRWKLAYPDAEVNLCDPGQDWNDLLQA